MKEAFYFGRFQPPLLKHGNIAINQGLKHQENLIVGIADSGFKQNRDNFLTGSEVQYLFHLTLAHLGRVDIPTTLVPLVPEQPFVDNLRSFFRSRGTTEGVTVFSGSGSTIKACEKISNEFGIEIIKLEDDDTSGPRSRQVREALVSDNLAILKELMAPCSIDFLTSEPIMGRIKSLPVMQKRPWAQDVQAIG